jgi:hypothetical protein
MIRCDIGCDGPWPNGDEMEIPVDMLLVFLLAWFFVPLRKPEPRIKSAVLDLFEHIDRNLQDRKD